MSPRLTLNMYRRGSTRFGLRDQQKVEDCPHEWRNCHWFNKRGDRLGDGDLSVTQYCAIAAGLRRGEVFVVLHQDFPHVAASINRQIYMAMHAVAIILPGQIYFHQEVAGEFGPHKVHTTDQLTLERLLLSPWWQRAFGRGR